jgi:hypothetical protein
MEGPTKKKIGFYVIFLIIVFFNGCSRDEPSGPGDSDTDIERLQQLEDFQAEGVNIMHDLLSDMSIESALDSLAVLVRLDSQVVWAAANEQGVAIEYQDGLLGGIFCDYLRDDNGGPASMSEPLMRIKKGTDTQEPVIPLSKKTILVDAIYSEIQSRTDGLLNDIRGWYSQAGYLQPVTRYDSEVTVSLMASLTDYGIIHLLSHSWKYPNPYDYVLFMTGEEWPSETEEEFPNEINKNIFRMTIVGGFYDGQKRYFIRPAILTLKSNFDESKPLIYGGFCFSFLGEWPSTIVNSGGAGAYVGFDWKVWKGWNFDWARDLYLNLTDVQREEPVTISQWFKDPSGIEKRYFNDECQRWIEIKYRSPQDLALWAEDPIHFHLFNARAAFDTGPRRSPDQALPFAEIAIALTRKEGDNFIVSSSPDGSGPWIVDNYITINGVRRSAGGEDFSGRVTWPPLIGEPIENTLGPIAPWNVTSLIPLGTSTVQFALKDWGAIAGNTEIFLTIQ